MNIENIKNFIKKNPVIIFIGTIVLLMIIYHYYTKENFGTNSISGLSSCCISLLCCIFCCFGLVSAFK